MILTLISFHTLFLFFSRYYCPPGQSLKEPPLYHCRVGHYCPGGTADQQPCPINQMANYTHAEKCDLCPAGFYCLQSGVPVECEKGFYCPAGTGKDLRPCPRGTYGPERQYNSVLDCKPCPSGKYCPFQNATTHAGECNPGHWCAYGVDRVDPIGLNQTLNETESTNATCYDGKETGYGGRCPEGHYCPRGAEKPIPCSTGTYAPIQGLEACYPCLKGFYCPANGLKDYQTYPCPAGHYCPNNTKAVNENPCPVGTFSDREGNVDLTDCKECSPGRFCPTQGKKCFDLEYILEELILSFGQFMKFGTIF